MAFVHLIPSILRRPSKRRTARPSRSNGIFAKKGDVDGKAAKRVPPSDFADTAAASSPPDDELPKNIADINLDEPISRPAVRKKRKNKPVVPEFDEPIAADNIEPQFPSDEEPLVLDDKNAKVVKDEAPVVAKEDPVAAKIVDEPKAVEPEPIAIDSKEPPTEPKLDDTEVSIPPAEAKSDEAEPPAEPKNGTGIKLSAEDVAASAKRKEAEDAEAAKKREAAMATRAKIFSQAQTAVAFAGEKTGVIDLGMRTRAQLETYLDGIIEVKDTKGEDGKPAAEKDPNAKLKLTAAKAFRSLSTALENQWKSKAVPAIKGAEFVPDEAKGLGEKSLASAALGLFVAVALLPALLGGGGTKEAPVQKAVERDTQTLQKKLDEKNKSSQTNADKAAERLIEKRRREREEKLFPKTDPVPESIMPQVEAPPAVPTPGPAPIAAPKPVVPVAPDGPKVEEKATPQIVLSAVRKELGAKSSGFIKTASFDSLAAAPTLVLESGSDLRNLSVAETRLLALSALKASRIFGYETVVVQEVGSGYEIARAGVDVLVGDETPTLRAEVTALRSKVESLAITNSEVTAKADSLLSRIAEERVITADKIAALNTALKEADLEKQALVQELTDASAEIAAIPDSKVLEERTAAAEEKTREMTQTVETLSRQVTVARDAEKLAEDNLEVANNNARLALEEKEAAFKEADGKVEMVRKEAADSMEKLKQEEDKVRAAITEEAMKEVKSAEKQATAAQNETERIRKEDSELLEAEKKKLEKLNADSAAQFEKDLAAERSESAKALDLVGKERDALVADKAKELKGVRAEYEKQIGELRSLADKSAVANKKEVEEAVKAAEKASTDELKLLEKELSVARAESSKQAEKTANYEDLKDEIGRVRSEKKEAEKSANEAEKSFARQLDDLKKEYAGKLDEYAKESDAKIKQVRDEARASVDTANGKVKEAEKDNNSMTRQVRNLTKDRDDLKKALDKAKAKNNNKETPAAQQEQAAQQAAEAKS